jgi:hypothetical protein
MLFEKNELSHLAHDIEFDKVLSTPKHLEHVEDCIINSVLHIGTTEGAKANGQSKYGQTMIIHEKLGAQLWVTQQVSDDLLCSDITEPDFGALHWPHQALEVFFEDPALPGFLVQFMTAAEREAHVSEVLGFVDFDELFLSRELMLRRKDTSLFMPNKKQDEPILTFLYNAKYKDDYPSIARGGTLHISEINLMTGTGGVEEFVRVAKQEFHSYKALHGHSPTGLDWNEAGVREMIHGDTAKLGSLLFKVLLFANSKGHAPQKVLTKPTKKEGGKVGFKNRPRLPRYAVRYLPEHLEARAKHARACRGSHSFKGRQGHWRTYHDDRFVNKKGDRDYIYPVPGPDGTFPPRKFVVRKPKGMSSISLPGAV